MEALNNKPKIKVEARFIYRDTDDNITEEIRRCTQINQSMPTYDGSFSVTFVTVNENDPERIAKTESFTNILYILVENIDDVVTKH